MHNAKLLPASLLIFFIRWGAGGTPPSIYSSIRPSCPRIFQWVYQPGHGFKFQGGPRSKSSLLVTVELLMNETKNFVAEAERIFGRSRGF